MPADQGMIIAKRSMSLAKTYAIIGAILAVFGIALSNLGQVIYQLTPGGIQPTNNGFDVQTVFPFLSVPILVFSALTFSTPVLLLYVYDKNNGVLEYFLSLGMDQSDVYRQYLRASLILAGIILLFEVATNLVVGLILGVDRAILATVSILTPIIAIPDTAFVAIIMMAFSSLQKQRVGSNQPLGIAAGIIVVMPAYLIPLAFPSIAIIADTVLALGIITASVVTFLLASRLIKREKMLP